MAESKQFSEVQLMELQRQIEALRKELNTDNKKPESASGDGRQNSTQVKKASVRVAQDEMTAWLSLEPPESTQDYQAEDIRLFLARNGVTSGLIASNISAMVKKKIYQKEVKVAVGALPEEGKDGYFEYYFHTKQTKGPVIRPNGSVDYSSMVLLQNVAKGEVVALYHRAVQGKDGYTVKGEAIQGKLFRELAPIRGRNIRRLEDEVTYVSEVDGKVELKDGRVDVQNVHEIHDDVTFVTGKVEFYGDIIIYGNVETGVTLRAGRNILVKGITEGVNMYAGGDITMEKGLVGGKKAKISARGSIYADFIENAVIEAKGDVNANIIMNSEIKCDGKVLLTGQKGAIIGGNTHGLMGIEAVNLGNDVEVKTIIHAGCDSITYEKFLDLHKQMQDTNQILEQTVEEMSDILKKKHKGKGRVTREEEQRILFLNERKDDCFNKLDDLKKDKEIMEGIINRGRDASIVCNGSIHGGVVIGLENAQLPIERSTSYMKYTVHNGVIEAEVIVK